MEIEMKMESVQQETQVDNDEYGYCTEESGLIGVGRCSSRNNQQPEPREVIIAGSIRDIIDMPPFDPNIEFNTFDSHPMEGFRSKHLVSVPVHDEAENLEKVFRNCPRSRFPGLTRDTRLLPSTLVKGNFICRNCGKEYKICEECDASKETVIKTVAFEEPLEFTCPCGKEYYITFYDWGGISGDDSDEEDR